MDNYFYKYLKYKQKFLLGKKNSGGAREESKKEPKTEIIDAIMQYEDTIQKIKNILRDIENKVDYIPRHLTTWWEKNDNKNKIFCTDEYAKQLIKNILEDNNKIKKLVKKMIDLADEIDWENENKSYITENATEQATLDEDVEECLFLMYKFENLLTFLDKINHKKNYIENYTNNLLNKEWENTIKDMKEKFIVKIREQLNEEYVP
tara:strand:- start:67 stop:684 length:618 start_codon:yes stop_codon:yes gene_type:complete